MRSSDIFDAIRLKYPGAALVPELTIDDNDLDLVAPEDIPEHKPFRRIDALMFESLLRTAIEIKVSVADFKRDTYWKRRAWKSVVHRFVYAVPEGLKVTAPHGCGLWMVSDSGKVRVVKNAIVSKTPEPLPQSVVQRMAYRATPPLPTSRPSKPLT